MSADTLHTIAAIAVGLALVAAIAVSFRALYGVTQGRQLSWWEWPAVLIGGPIAGALVLLVVLARRRTPSGRSDDAPDQDDTDHPMAIHPDPHPKRSTTRETTVADDLDAQRDGTLGERLRRFRERAAEDRANGTLGDE